MISDKKASGLLRINVFIYKRIYMLYQLKRAGVNQTDLVTIYISVVRPVVEYACPVWSTNLPVYLSDNLLNNTTLCANWSLPWGVLRS